MMEKKEKREERRGVRRGEERRGVEEKYKRGSKGKERERREMRIEEWSRPEQEKKGEIKERNRNKGNRK